MKILVLTLLAAATLAQAQKPDDVLLKPIERRSGSTAALPIPPSAAAATPAAAPAPLMPPVPSRAFTHPVIDPATKAVLDPKSVSIAPTKIEPAVAFKASAASTSTAPPTVTIAPPASPPSAASPHRANPFLGRTAENEALLAELERERIKSLIEQEKANQAKSRREAHSALPPPISPLPATLTPSLPTTASPRTPAAPARRPARGAKPITEISAAAMTLPSRVEAPRLATPVAKPTLVGVISEAATPKALVAVSDGLITIDAFSHKSGVKVGAVRATGAEVDGEWLELGRVTTRVRMPERLAAPAATANVPVAALPVMPASVSLAPPPTPALAGGIDLSR